MKTKTVKTNSLRYTTSKLIGNGERLTVKIRLDDEYKNGHQDFAITGDIYYKGRMEAGGCIHDDILKHFPEFKIFVNLHLCDFNGIPMHAVSNGFYHLENGFNRTKRDSKEFRTEFCDYYRLTPEQFDIVEKSYSKTHYSILLGELGVFDQWKREAIKAIELLEELTGKEFLNDSERDNRKYDTPSQDQINEEKEKIENGYYTPKAQKEREKEAIKKFIEEEKQELKDKIFLMKQEQKIKLSILRIGGKPAYKSVIVYNHTKKVVFNWSGLNNISMELYRKIKDRLRLPKGYTLHFKED